MWPKTFQGKVHLKRQVLEIKENIYGHLKRFNWITSHINKKDTIVEVGCGTGCMIALPLAKMGYNISGIDKDTESIAFGQELSFKEGINPNNLNAIDLSELNMLADVIILSEVLEHITDEDIPNTFRMIRDKFKPGGHLLITIPNGYGWFEMESFLWFKTGFGHLIEWLKVDRIIKIIKSLVFSCDIIAPPPSTLARSQHVQRFTYSKIQKLLQSQGFEVKNIAGSVLFSGPFSNMLFSGIKPLMKLNCALGSWFSRIASGFFILCKLPD